MTETLESPDIYGDTIFCDDIRYEVDGKVSYIGSYSGSRLIVHGAFPVTLPKFGFGITFWQRRDMAVKDIAFKIFLPEDPEDQASLQFGADSLDFGDIAKESPYLTIEANVVISSLQLKAPGQIRVRALRDGKLHRLGSLVVSSKADDAKS